MFYNARWYDPTLGRFTSADTIIPGGAQGLDRYAYVNNSPINYTDPSGHCPEDDAGCRARLSDTLPGAVHLKHRAWQLIDFSESVGMTPEDVIGIGLGHEMMTNPADRDKQMEAFRNGFLRYANVNCGGKSSYNCMLNYFAGSYESVYGQFLTKESKYTKPNLNFWGNRDKYLWAQYINDKTSNNSNLGGGNQKIVKKGIDFMGSFMGTISSYSYNPELALNTGVYDEQALKDAIGGYPTSDMGFLVVISGVRCPNTGTKGFSVIYSLKGEQAIGALKDC